MPPESTRSPRAPLEYLALLVWSLLLFGSLLPGDYLADDYFLIANLTDPQGGLDGSAVADLWSQVPSAGQPRFVRPVWRASYALDQLFVQWGWGAPASRLVEFALHALCAWFLLRWLERLAVPRGGARFAAFLMVVLPLPTEAVVWVAARCDLLAVAGVLCAFWLRARALARSATPRARSELGVWLAMTVALWSKESAAAGGVVLLAQEFLHPARAGLPLSARARAAAGFLARGVLVASLLGAHRLWLLDELSGGYDGQSLTRGDLVLAAGRNFSVLAFPIGHLIPLPFGPRGATTIAQAASAGLLVLAAWPRASVGLRLGSLWLLASVWVLTSLRVETPDAAHTRLLYQPSLALCAVYASLLAGLVPRRVDAANPTGRAVAQALGVGLVVAALSFHRPAVADYAAAQREMQAFREAVAGELERNGDGLVLIGPPEMVGGRAVCGLNIFPAVLRPPFLGAGPDGGRFKVVGSTPESGLDGRFSVADLVVLLSADRRLLEWSDGALRPASEVEARGERREQVELERVGQFGFRLRGAAPGVGLALLGGRPGQGMQLGAAGRVEVLSARILTLATTDVDGTAAIKTPRALFAAAAAAEQPLAVQAVILESDGVRLSNLVKLEESASDNDGASGRASEGTGGER